MLSVQHQEVNDVVVRMLADVLFTCTRTRISGTCGGEEDWIGRRPPSKSSSLGTFGTIPTVACIVLLCVLTFKAQAADHVLIGSWIDCGFAAGSVVRFCRVVNTRQRPATGFSGLLALLVRLVTSLCLVAPTVAVLPFLCRVSSLCFGLCLQFAQFVRIGVVILNLAQLIPLTTCL